MWQQVKQVLVDSTARFLTRFASLLPGLAALVVAVLLSVISAWILAAIVRRVLVSFHFDERMDRGGVASLAEWSPMNSPTRLVSRSVGALVILSGFLLGLAAFDFQWTYLFVQNIFGYIPNVLAALLVLLVGNVVARFLARSLLIGAVNLNLQYARFLSVGVKWIVIVLAFAMALEHLKIAPRIVELAFAILFGGIVLTLSLVVGLRSKDLVTTSLERAAKHVPAESVEDSLRHL
jgi:Mechanosensitive ion channel, conserved TM helix